VLLPGYGDAAAPSSAAATKLQAVLPPPPPACLCLQDAWEVLAVYSAHGSLEADSAAVVAAQSFWDYAQQTDRALPGVSLLRGGCLASFLPGLCYALTAGRSSPSRPAWRAHRLARPCVLLALPLTLCRWGRHTRPQGAASAWQRAASPSATA
jgi:hypothetical protein